MSPVELAEFTYLDAVAETQKVLTRNGVLAAASAAAYEIAMCEAMLLVKDESGECHRVGCREKALTVHCAEHLTEVAS